MNEELGSSILAMLRTMQEEFSRRLSRLEDKQTAEKEFFTPEEVATALRRKPYTVREWCRLKRIDRQKDKYTGRFSISLAELDRLRNGGRLNPPVQPSRA